MYVQIYQKIKTYKKVDIFLIYLCTDASCGKMDAKYVISDLENPQGLIF